MTKRMSGVEWLITLTISLALIVITVLSFTHCFTVTHHPEFSAWGPHDPYSNNRITVTSEGFSPVLMCVFTAIQLILLWFVDKFFACIAGGILNFYATAIKALQYFLADMGNKILVDHIYDYSPSYSEYSFRITAYLIVVIGIAVTFLYIALLFYRTKRISSKTNVEIDTNIIEGGTNE